MEIDELIKELDKKLIVIKKEIIRDTMYVYCDTHREETQCKYCGTISNSVHSIYQRTISDLPIQEYKVKLLINVKKYFCVNPKCNHKTFAESLDFVEENALRTKRLDEYINKIGLKNSSLETKRQLNDSHVNISNNTILRILKKKKSVN